MFQQEPSPSQELQREIQMEKASQLADELAADDAYLAWISEGEMPF